MHQNSPTFICNLQNFSRDYTRTPVEKGGKGGEGKGREGKGRDGKGMAGERREGREEEGRWEGSRRVRKGWIAHPVIIC
jgi:hypothetical protein